MNCDSCSKPVGDWYHRLIADRSAPGGHCRVTMNVCGGCVGGVLHDLSDSKALLCRRLSSETADSVWALAIGLAKAWKR